MFFVSVKFSVFLQLLQCDWWKKTSVENHIWKDFYRHGSCSYYRLSVPQKLINIWVNYVTLM